MNNERMELDDVVFKSVTAYPKLMFIRSCVRIRPDYLSAFFIILFYLLFTKKEYGKSRPKPYLPKKKVPNRRGPSVSPFLLLVILVILVIIRRPSFGKLLKPTYARQHPTQHTFQQPGPCISTSDPFKTEERSTIILTTQHR